MRKSERRWEIFSSVAGGADQSSEADEDEPSHSVPTPVSELSDDELP